MNKNKTWRENHAKIHDAYLALIRTLQRKPSLEEVSKQTKLSVNTVHKHLKSLEFVPSDHELRVLNDSVLLAIFNGAMQGNAAMARLWVQLFNPELLVQRVGDADGGNLREASVLILPHNNRDLLPGKDADFIEVEAVDWDAAEKEVLRLREANKKD